jgi:hypothetical protein
LALFVLPIQEHNGHRTANSLGSSETWTSLARVIYLDGFWLSARPLPQTENSVDDNPQIVSAFQCEDGREEVVCAILALQTLPGILAQYFIKLFDEPIQQNSTMTIKDNEGRFM